MLNGYLAKAAAILLLFSFPTTLLPAQTPAATPERAGVLYPQEGVSVKGSPVFTSTAVYAGDEIQTGKLSTLLTGEGVSLQLKPHTALKFGKTAELGCGGLVLVTRHSIPVRLAGIEVIPSGNPAKLEVDNAGGTATVSVKSGTATLNQGGQISSLREGQAITRPVAQRCPAAVAGSSPASTPAMSSSFLSGNGLYWVLGGGAAAGVMAGVMATRGGKQVSPSVP
ncbi:MAG TPA: hypothetical protein VKB60_03665 [Terriglobales bacterium]|nr:hypothetical protein [Terriglobales bacterium]